MTIIQKFQEVERENMILRSDLSRAIGRMRGLGWPDLFLERKYSELFHLKSREMEISQDAICTIHGRKGCSHEFVKRNTK